MAISSFFRTLHTAPGNATLARFSQDMTIYASVIFILSAGVGTGAFIGNTFSSKPMFEQGVAEKMETLDVTLKKISTNSNDHLYHNHGYKQNSSKSVADALRSSEI